MNIFERDEISLEAALKGLSVLDAVARAVGDPKALAAMIKVVEQAKDATAASDAATKLAREEREAADKRLALLDQADKDHTEYVTRTTKELNQRRSDLDENEAIIAQREHIVGQREREVAEERRKIEAAKAAVRAHIGEAA